MKFGKKLLISVLALLSALCFAFSFGCNLITPTDPNPTESDWDAVELMTDFTVPYYQFEGLTEEQFTDGTVTYKFTSPEYVNDQGETVADVYESFFPNVYCDRVGTWKVVYIYGSQRVAKSFEVVDTTAPILTFSELSHDVYLGAKQVLPNSTIKDFSKVDLTSRTDTVVLYTCGDTTCTDESHVVDVEVKHKGYTPTTTGRIVYTMTMADEYGNKAVATQEWNVKDPTWTDQSVDTDYLADYDEFGYVNTASSGYVSSYWTDSEIREEYFETFEGANGVLKVSAAPNSKALGCFSFKLQDKVYPEDLETKVLMLKLYTPNQVNYLWYGCMTDQGSTIGMAHIVKMPIVPNQWNYIVIPTTQLHYGYFRLGDEFIDAFQICWGGNGANDYKMSEDLVVYLDSVSLAEEISVSNVTMTDNELSWTGHPNATGYEVLEGDKLTVVNDTTYTVTDKKAKIGVRALADGKVTSLEQQNYTPYIDMTAFEQGDIALFDTASYELLASKNSSKGSTREADTIKAEYLSSYNGVDNVLKVTTTNNNVLGETGIGDIVLKLPKACTDGLTLKYMCTKSDATALRFLQPNSEYGWDGVKDITVGNEWQTVYMPYTGFYTSLGVVPCYDQIDIMIQGGAVGAENVFYFAIVKNDDCAMDLLFSNLKETLKENELAMYDDKLYEKTVFADYSPKSGRYYDITATYLESYEGMTGVMKIDVVNDEYSDGKFTLKLLNSHNGTYTIRYRIEVADGNTGSAIMVPTSSAGNEDANQLNLTEDVWHVKCCTTNSPDNNQIIYYNYGANAKFTIYIDGVWSGDQVVDLELANLAANLGENELAMYDDAKYALTLNPAYSPWQGSSFNVTATQLASYEGMNGVLKLTVVNDVDGNSAAFSLRLLKAHSGTYTIRYRVEVPADGKAPGIITTAQYNGAINVSTIVHDNPNGINMSLNTWHVLCVTTGSSVKDYIAMYNWGAGSKFNIYIDGIWDGDQTANLN
ncbi:MAG: hypothetical protein E7348_06910 [Clostridiales bacterium]|nr:hypothetical protein [Clostridiales bacterium]